MSGRNLRSQVPLKDAQHGGLRPPAAHEPPFVRGPGRVPHPALLEEMRKSHYGLAGPRSFPPYPAIIEQWLAIQQDDIQGLLVDNQRLAATHVALRQELEVTQYEFQRVDKFAQSLHAENDLQMRELHEKSLKMEDELSTMDAMRVELLQVQVDIKELTAARQDLTAQVQVMTQDLARVTIDLQQVPGIMAEIEGLRHELEQARAATEYEKKGFAENFEHGKLMEDKLVSMARELEKLRAEMANAEKRARATAASGNPGTNYNGNYGNREAGYPGNPVGYGMNPTSSMHSVAAGAEGYPHYRSGPGPGPGPGPGAWGAYNMVRPQGPR